jgi:hypothetical protein
MVEKLLNNNSFEGFFDSVGEATITSPTGKTISARRFASYALRRGFIAQAA